MDLGLGTYLSGSPAPIAYDLGSRFELTVTKEQLRAAKTIYDIVPGDPEQDIVSYSSVSIRTFVDEKQTEVSLAGSDPVLDQAQLEFLWSLPYSSNFSIWANFKEKDAATGTIRSNYASPHITIVPEHEAANSVGKEAMIAHVRKSTAAFAHMVDAKSMRTGKVYFTVAKDGTVSAARLSESSGYPLLDKQVLELVHTLPGTWRPASNAVGEAVEQEFVFSFGAVGC
jgi:TonB family protein